MTKYEQFTYDQITPELAPGETIQVTAFLFNKSLVGMFLFGAMAALGSGYFFAAATDRCLYIIKTKMGLLSVKMINDGIIKIPYTDIVSVEPGGALNQKTIGINTLDGSKVKFKLNTISGIMSGQKQFIDKVTQLAAAGKKV